MNIQNERIQELIDIVKQKDETIMRLQGQIAHSEETIKDYVSIGHTVFIQKIFIYAYNGLYFGKLEFSVNNCYLLELIAGQLALKLKPQQNFSRGVCK